MTTINDSGFSQAWEDDIVDLKAPFTKWGLDTSNVAAINDTNGVAYVFANMRLPTDKSNSYLNYGLAAVSVTTPDSGPVASRVSPLLGGPSAIPLGLIGIMRTDDYVYHYSAGGPSNVIVSRVPSADAFDATQYQFLDYSSQIWDTVGDAGIPNNDTQIYGAQTANAGGKITCNIYGSVFYSNYLQQYSLGTLVR